MELNIETKTALDKAYTRLCARMDEKYRTDSAFRFHTDQFIQTAREKRQAEKTETSTHVPRGV